MFSNWMSLLCSLLPLPSAETDVFDAAAFSNTGMCPPSFRRNGGIERVPLYDASKAVTRQSFEARQHANIGVATETD